MQAPSSGSIIRQTNPCMEWMPGRIPVHSLWGEVNMNPMLAGSYFLGAVLISLYGGIIIFVAKHNATHTTKLIYPWEAPEGDWVNEEGKTLDEV